MGWINLSSQMDTETAPIENKKSVADADIMRVLVWGASVHFPNGVTVPAVIDGDGNILTPASVRQPTGAEVHRAITEQIYYDIKTKVEAFEKSVGYAQVDASVQPIVLTPAV